jgi:hypothetical protein
MSTLYEYYNTGADSALSIYAANWGAQTFTPAIAHKITSVKLLLYRTGSPGIITVSIRATDGSGHPTGEDLCSGTTNGDTLPTGSPYEWREITLGDGYDLSAGTKYAIVARMSGGDTDNRFLWRRDISGSAYAGGNLEYSTNSGSTWTGTGHDFMFEDWGELAVTQKTSSDTGSGADACVLLETGEAKTSSDVGSGVDDTPMPSATLAGSESGSGIDALIARLLAAVDTGTDTEVSTLFTALLRELAASERGEGSDSLAAKIEMPTKGGGMKLWT